MRPAEWPVNYLRIQTKRPDREAPAQISILRDRKMASSTRNRSVKIPGSPFAKSISTLQSMATRSKTEDIALEDEVP
jgi:hypothetical protein